MLLPGVVHLRTVLCVETGEQAADCLFHRNECRWIDQLADHHRRFGRAVAQSNFGLDSGRSGRNAVVQLTSWGWVLELNQLQYPPIFLFSYFSLILSCYVDYLFASYSLLYLAVARFAHFLEYSSTTSKSYIDATVIKTFLHLWGILASRMFGDYYFLVICLLKYHRISTTFFLGSSCVNMTSR